MCFFPTQQRTLTGCRIHFTQFWNSIRFPRWRARSHRTAPVQMPNARPDCHLCLSHLAISWSFPWLLFHVPAQEAEFQTSGHLVLLVTSPILRQCRSPFHINSGGLKRIFLWMAKGTRITPGSPRVLRALCQEPGLKTTFSITKYNSDAESRMKQIYNSISIKSTHSLNH